MIRRIPISWSRTAAVVTASVALALAAQPAAAQSPDDDSSEVSDVSADSAATPEPTLPSSDDLTPGLPVPDDAGVVHSWALAPGDGSAQAGERPNLSYEIAPGRPGRRRRHPLQLLQRAAHVRRLRHGCVQQRRRIVQPPRRRPGAHGCRHLVDDARRLGHGAGRQAGDRSRSRSRCPSTPLRATTSERCSHRRAPSAPARTTRSSRSIAAPARASTSGSPGNSGRSSPSRTCRPTTPPRPTRSAAVQR